MLLEALYTSTEAVVQLETVQSMEVFLPIFSHQKGFSWQLCTLHCFTFPFHIVSLCVTYYVVVVQYYVIPLPSALVRGSELRIYSHKVHVYIHTYICGGSLSGMSRGMSLHTCALPRAIGRYEPYVLDLPLV